MLTTAAFYRLLGKYRTESTFLYPNLSQGWLGSNKLVKNCMDYYDIIFKTMVMHSFQQFLAEFKSQMCV